LRPNHSEIAEFEMKNRCKNVEEAKAEHLPVSSQVYFIATFKTRKRKQRKIIQSPSQPYLYRPSITLKLNYNNKRKLR